jgi:hypothetical protein
MVRKAVGQVSLVEAPLPAALGSNQRLERITAQVDWAPIELLLQPMRRAPTGRPAYPPLVQLRALLLQHRRGLLTAPALQSALPFLLDGKGTVSRIGISKKRGGPVLSDSLAAGISLVLVVVRPPISRSRLSRMPHPACTRPEPSEGAGHCNSQSSG